MQPDNLTTLTLPIALFVIMLGLGLGLEPCDFKRVRRQPRVLLIGLACQLFLLPLLGILVILLLDLSPLLSVGLLIIAFSPGGATSNIIAYLAKADLALSVSLTALTSLIAPFTLTLFTGISIQILLNTTVQPEISVAPTLLKLLMISVCPIVIGMLLRRYLPVLAKGSEKPVKLLSLGLLATIIAAILEKNWSNLDDFIAQAGPAALSLNLLAMFAGFSIARRLNLSFATSKTIGIELGMQNGAMALFMTSTILASPEISIPPIVYSLMMTLTCLVFVGITSRHKEKINDTIHQG